MESWPAMFLALSFALARGRGLGEGGEGAALTRCVEAHLVRHLRVRQDAERPRFRDECCKGRPLTQTLSPNDEAVGGEGFDARDGASVWTVHTKETLQAKCVSPRRSGTSVRRRGRHRCLCTYRI